MYFKLYLLTILVAVLSVLSFWVVFTDASTIKLSEVSSSAFAKGKVQNGGSDLEADFVLPVSEPTYFPIRNTEIFPPELTAKSFLIYDTKNAKVIFSKDPGRSLPIASLTKLLTAVIGLDHLNLDDTLEITSDTYNVDGGGADFHLYEQLSFKDLLGAMLVKSSNDAAVAIAKAVEKKTGQSFSSLMNRQARQIGMENSRFLDPAGLNDDASTTARDFLQLVLYSKNYPEIWKLIGSPSINLASIDGKFVHHFESTDKLWGVLQGLIGGKTGYTDGALGCMIIEEKLSEQDSSLIVILLGSSDRFGEVKKLTDWAKMAFRWN